LGALTGIVCSFIAGLLAAMLLISAAGFLIYDIVFALKTGDLATLSVIEAARYLNEKPEAWVHQPGDWIGLWKVLNWLPSWVTCLLAFGAAWIAKVGLWEIAAEAMNRSEPTERR
jgi:hypothetical protein